MKTITSKTAKNGAQLWYVDGKRTSRNEAARVSIANGRENLSNLVAGLTADPAVCNDIGIVAAMKSEFGDRYGADFYFATAQDAVKAAKKIVALGTKQVHRVVIDNCRPYASNIRYADTVRGKLVFLNGFERFDETEAETVNSEVANNGEIAKFEVGKRYSGKAYNLERYRGKYRRSKPFDTTILVTKRTNSFLYAALAGYENYPVAYKIRTDDATEYIDYGHGHYFRADNVVSDIFNRESITVGTHAEAWTLIESTANDIFAFDFEQSGIENNDNFVQRNFKNVHRGAPEYKTFSFDEIFIDDRLSHVNFKNGNRSVRIFIATPDTPDKPTRKADTVTDEVNDTVTDDGNVGNLTDSALAASNSRLTAFNIPEEKVEKLFDAYEAQSSVAHISENGYIAAVNYQPQNSVYWHCKIRRYENLDEAIDAVRYVNEHDTFTVTYGGRVEVQYGKRNERTRDYFARNMFGVEYFKEAYFDELADQYAVTVDAFNFAVDRGIELSSKAAETVAEADGYDESVFDMIPTVDDLNDVDGFDSEGCDDCDRDNRFNRGEVHAAKLEKQLREIDPTVSVTYDIDSDDEDSFYLSFGRYIYRTPFGTIRAVESTFHLWRHDQLVDDLNDIGDDIINTREILERKVVEGASQAELKNLAEYIADRNREYADLYKAAYGEEPAAGDIDLDADKILNRAMSKNLTDLERLRDEEDSGIINVTVDGKYRLIERMSMATPQYRLEDENGHRVPLNEIDYHDWVTDNFGELFDSYGDLRYDEYGEYPIDDVCDRLEDYHTLSLWYDN